MVAGMIMCKRPFISKIIQSDMKRKTSLSDLKILKGDNYDCRKYKKSKEVF